MRNVLVSGGSKGVGLGVARRLAAAGYQVIAIARNESPALAEAMAQVRMEGVGAIWTSSPSTCR